MSIELTVVVVSYNTRNMIQRCLDHLTRLNKIGKVRIVVVDNASTDGSVELVRDRYRDVLLIVNDHNVGFARANNQGIACAHGAFVLLLNSDAFITDQGIQALIHFMHNHPNVGICGPQLLFENGDWQRSFGLIPSLKSAFLDMVGITSLVHILYMLLWRLGNASSFRAHAVDYVDGACMLVRREVFDQIGVLDERFFMYVEDCEFCLRARKCGWQVYYVPQSRVIHIRGGSTARNAVRRKIELKNESLRVFFLEQYGQISWAIYNRWMYINFYFRHSVYKLLFILSLVSHEQVNIYRELRDCYTTDLVQVRKDR